MCILLQRPPSPKTDVLPKKTQNSILKISKVSVSVQSHKLFFSVLHHPQTGSSWNSGGDKCMFFTLLWCVMHGIFGKYSQGMPTCPCKPKFQLLLPPLPMFHSAVSLYPDTRVANKFCYLGVLNSKDFCHE